jgi:acyl-CoA thioesterase-1
MMKKKVIFCLAFAFVLLISCSRKEIKIACVGDSITEGYGLACQSKTAYPVVLDSIMGTGYSVLNCGRSATTLQKHGDFPYWISKEFYDVFAYNPDIIIIKLGTNDTKSYNWNAENFEKDYQSLIDTFSTIPSKPKIYLCLPVPVYKTTWGINDSTVTAGIIPIIKKLAAANKLTYIDLYHQMSNQAENFPDGVHPNEKAVKIMAAVIARKMKSETK